MKQVKTMTLPLEFQHSAQTIRAYTADVTATKFYDLDPDFQRDFIKNEKWKQDIIGHIMWTRQTGILYFHPVRRNGGPEIQESLDGKSRSGAILQFIRDGFRMPTPLPKEYNLRHLEGKLFSEWPQEDQDAFWRIKCQLAVANRTMSPEVVTRFFNNIKTPSDISLGEGLHSDTKSPVYTLLKREMAEPNGKFKRFLHDMWSQKRRYEDLEVIVRCLWWQLNPNTRHEPSPPVLLDLWRTGAGVTAPLMEKVCENMVKVRIFTRTAKVTRLQYAANFCPFFLLFAKETPTDILAAIEAKLTSDPFKNAGLRAGQSSTHYSRWLALMRLGGSQVDNSLDLDM
jgi:hypothetical protein